MNSKDNKPVDAKLAFTKKAILASEQFCNRKDIVNAILSDGKTYTVDEVNRKIENYMKGKVK